MLFICAILKYFNERRDLYLFRFPVSLYSQNRRTPLHIQQSIKNERLSLPQETTSPLDNSASIFHSQIHQLHVLSRSHLLLLVNSLSILAQYSVVRLIRVGVILALLFSMRSYSSSDLHEFNPLAWLQKGLLDRE